VQVTRDGGTAWSNVTPKDLPEWARISLIEASPWDAGTAYLAANRFQMNDFAPYIYRTTDYGRSWTRITNGIAASEFVRAVRADPVRKGMLFAGTERGVWVSFDDGSNWQRLQQNLPPVPVHDLAIKEGDLIAATHGRGFWILDDLSVLRQLAPDQLQQDVHLFKPRDAYRIVPGFFFGGGSFGWDGASVQYWLKQANQKVTIDFLDAKGAVIRSFSSDQDSVARVDSLRGVSRKASLDSLNRLATDSLGRLGVLSGSVRLDPPADPPRLEGFRYQPPPRAPNKAGMNRFNWNLRSADAVGFTGMITWAGGTAGPTVPPGTYSVRVTAGGKSETETFNILRDPRTATSQADLDAQYAFLTQVRDRTSEANNAVRTIRNVKAQLAERRARAGNRGAAFDKLAAPLEAQLSGVEETLYQVKNRSGQDPLNYPIRLNDQLSGLGNVADGAEARPTAQTLEVYRILSGQLDVQLKRLADLLGGGLAGVNGELARIGLDKITPGTAEIPAP